MIEPIPPLALVKYQQWFAHAMDNCPDLPILTSSKERLNIYRIGFHSKLTHFLEKGLPLVFLFLGDRIFVQEIVLPFFKKHPPPDDCSIDNTGLHLIKWTEDHFQGDNKEMVLLFMKADHLYRISAQETRICVGDEFLSEDFFSIALKLQPHVSLIAIGCNLLALRESALKNDKEPFPHLQKRENYRYIIFRNVFNVVVYEELNELQHLFLKSFEKRSSFNEAAAHLNAQVIADLQSWFSLWYQRGILVPAL